MLPCVAPQRLPEFGDGPLTVSHAIRFRPAQPRHPANARPTLLRALPGSPLCGPLVGGARRGGLRAPGTAAPHTGEEGGGVRKERAAWPPWLEGPAAAGDDIRTLRVRRTVRREERLGRRRSGRRARMPGAQEEEMRPGGWACVCTASPNRLGCLPDRRRWDRVAGQRRLRVACSRIRAWHARERRLVTMSQRSWDAVATT